MEHKRSTVGNGEVAIDFRGEGNYTQRAAPHSPTLGHVQWNSFNIENETSQQQVSYYFSLIFSLFSILDNIIFARILRAKFDRYDIMKYSTG